MLIGHTVNIWGIIQSLLGLYILAKFNHVGELKTNKSK
jgi:hypothetical protein